MSSEQEEYETALVQLRETISDYARLDDELSELNGQRELVAVVGNLELPGFVRVEITNPSRIVSYDARALDALLLELDAAGSPLAARIREAKREGQRVGSLKISRER